MSEYQVIIIVLTVVEIITNLLIALICKKDK